MTLQFELFGYNYNITLEYEWSIQNIRMPNYELISSRCRGCFGLSFDSKLLRCPRSLSALAEQPKLAAKTLPTVRGQCPITDRARGNKPRLKLTSTLMARQVTETTNSPRAGVAEHLAEHPRPRQLALLRTMPRNYQASSELHHLLLRATAVTSPPSALTFRARVEYRR